MLDHILLALQDAVDGARHISMDIESVVDTRHVRRDAEGERREEEGMTWQTL